MTKNGLSAMDARLKRFLEYHVDPQAEWQGGVFDFSELTGSFVDSPMSGAKIVLWVSSERRIVHAKPIMDGTPIDLLLLELLEFAELQDFEYRPARIDVTDKEMAEQLHERFAGSGTTVTWNPEPDFWSDVKEDMANNISSQPAAPSLADSDCSLVQIRAFAKAAAAFYRSRLWRYLDDADLLRIQTPKPLKHLKYATVLGAGRCEFGLGFYDTPNAHWDIRSQRSNIDSLEVFSLTFNPISDAIDNDVGLWQENNLPLETGDAFPLFSFHSRNDTRAPKPKELEFATIVLSALAETSEEEIDSGEWAKQVTAQGKKTRCKISIPDLLDPPDRTEWLDRGMAPDPRGNERHFRMIQSSLAQSDAMDLEELNNFLNSQFSGSIDELEYPSETSFDRAENLCYAAIDTYGRRRTQLARQAIQEDPTHIEAHVLLAESVHDTTRKIELFRTAVELGAERYADFMKTETGHFWEIAETRPVVRAKYGLADALAADGHVNEAITQMLDILRLNANDNLGIRYEVIPLLLSLNRENEAIEVLDRYQEESANWLYLKAQVEFRKGGPRGRTAQKAMADAFRFNPNVIKLLTAEEPPMMPEHYALGSPEEAAIVIEEQMDSWTETEGFLEWMFARFAAWERDSSKRDRDKKRKARAKKRKPKKNRK